MKELRCYAVAAPGLAELVATELHALGIAGQADAGGVSWSGDLRALYQANLWLRTATRVIVRLARFRATTFWELERRAGSVDWGAIVAPGATVAFRVTAKKSKLYHSDAVAERLAGSVTRAVPGVRIVKAGADDVDGEPTPGDAASGPVSGERTQLFVVRLSHDDLTLSADSSGVPLYQRGYRQAVAKAPLRETLAAALLLSAGWKPDEPLVDPFCGAGTIPLEAALIASRIAPGLAGRGRVPREFAFERWPGFKGNLWRECVDAAREVALSSPGIVVAGSDRDAGAIEASRSNAERAGLADAVRFEVAPVSAFPVPEGKAGWVVTNPPYGMRVGDQSDVRRLYAALGRTLRERAAGWHLAMLSPDPRLDGITGREAGRPLAERVRTRNGGIPVRMVVG